MKTEVYILNREEVQQNLLFKIGSIECDGKTQVTISDANSKSVRQRGLQWTWYKDVVKSGIGGRFEEDTEHLDLFAKWKWCRPILLADEDSLFADIYKVFMQGYGKDPGIVRQFTKDWIHTEHLTTSGMAEFLTNFQQYYTEKGVLLTDPIDKKLLEFEQFNESQGRNNG